MSSSLWKLWSICHSSSSERGRFGFREGEIGHGSSSTKGPGGADLGTGLGAVTGGTLAILRTGLGARDLKRGGSNAAVVLPADMRVFRDGVESVLHDDDQYVDAFVVF